MIREELVPLLGGGTLGLFRLAVEGGGDLRQVLTLKVKLPGDFNRGSGRSFLAVKYEEV